MNSYPPKQIAAMRELAAGIYAQIELPQSFLLAAMQIMTGKSSEDCLKGLEIMCDVGILEEIKPEYSTPKSQFKYKLKSLHVEQ